MVLHDEAQVVVLVGVRMMVRVGVRVEVGWRAGPGLRVRMMVGGSVRVGVRAACAPRRRCPAPCPGCPCCR